MYKKVVLFTYILNHMFNNGINVIERKSFLCNCLYTNVCVSKWLMEHSDDTLLWKNPPMTYLTSKVDYDQQCNSMPYICLHIRWNIFLMYVYFFKKCEKIVPINKNHSISCHIWFQFWYIHISKLWPSWRGLFFEDIDHIH